jgi:hypothetical protein
MVPADRTLSNREALVQLESKYPYAYETRS